MDGTRGAAILLVWILFVLKCMTVWGDDVPVMDTAEITVQVNERDKAILPCMVQTITPENEDKYKVLWMSPDRQLLTLSMDRITSNPRFSVFRPFPTVWNLQIDHVRAEDAGSYLCQMNTPPTVQKKNVKLLVHVKPKISASPTVKVVEGRELRMTCNVTGIPPPTLKWFKEGKLLPNYTDELFSVKAVSRTDAGEYKCEASNDDDKDSKTISVIVFYAPTVSVRNDRIGQVPNKEAVLECQARGNPPGSIDWYRRGTKLETNWRYEIQTFAHEGDKRTLSLQVRSVSADDYGAYVCVAENQVGRDQATLTLYELSTPPVPPLSDQIPGTRRYNYDTDRRTTLGYGDPNRSRDDGTSARRQIITDSKGIETNDSEKNQQGNKATSSGSDCGLFNLIFFVFASYCFLSI